MRKNNGKGNITMKKVLALLLALIMTVSIISAIAEEAVEEASTESQFEKISLKKGTLLSKQYNSVNSISGKRYDGYKYEDASYNPIYAQTAVVTDIESGLKYYALRFIHDYYRGSSSQSGVSVLDSDEIDGVLTTIRYIKEHYREFIPYTDVAYTANSGVKVGAFVGAKNSYYYMELNSYDTVYFDMSEADALINFFTTAQTALKSMMN